MNVEHDHRNGAVGCRVCSKHDHSDSTPFALDRDHHPVPAWWFTCPKCGTRDSQLHAHEWTPAGIQWMRANPDKKEREAS